MSDAPSDGPARSLGGRLDIGWAALVVAILVLSLGSTISRKVGAPGITLACARSLLAGIIWNVVLLVQRRHVTWESLKVSLVPGIVFGVNIAFFFSAVTHTRVANVEFTGSLNPLLVVPLGALLFHERIPWHALVWAAPAILGVALVALTAKQSAGQNNALGMTLSVGAIFTWTAYLLVVKSLRHRIDIAQFMAGMCVSAGVVLLPFSIAKGFIGEIPAHGWPWLVLLTIQNGVVAHTLLLVAQRTIPVGTISTLQVSQPALAAGAAWMLLGEHLRPIQFVGMGIVIGSLVLYTLALQRRRAEATELVALEQAHE